MRVTKAIALDLSLVVLPLAYMERSESLVVQFMKGRGSRPRLAHDLKKY